MLNNFIQAQDILEQLVIEAGKNKHIEIERMIPINPQNGKWEIEVTAVTDWKADTFGNAFNAYFKLSYLTPDGNKNFSENLSLPLSFPLTEEKKQIVINNASGMIEKIESQIN